MTTPRLLDLRITAGQQAGFVAWEAGEIVAAFSGASELAYWVEERARQIEQADSGGHAGLPLGHGPQDTDTTGATAASTRDLAVLLRPGHVSPPDNDTPGAQAGTGSGAAAPADAVGERRGLLRRITG